MKVGFLSFSAGSATQWVAQGAGFFTKYGIDAELEYIAPATLSKAVIAGSIDIGQGSSTSVANAVAEGPPLVMIACNV